MDAKKLSVLPLCLAMFAISNDATADRHRPTCDEEPGLRDCVKVEDPDAKPPQPSVYRNPKPGGPVVRPPPATTRPKAN